MLPKDNADGTDMDQISTERYTVTIAADGTWTGTVVPLDAAGQVVDALRLLDVPPTYAGTLPGDASTEFVPFVRAAPGPTPDSTGLATPRRLADRHHEQLAGDAVRRAAERRARRPPRAPRHRRGRSVAERLRAGRAPSSRLTGSQNGPTAAVAGA